MSEFNKLPFYSIQNSAAFKKKRRKEVPWETQRKLLFHSGRNECEGVVWIILSNLIPASFTPTGN